MSKIINKIYDIDKYAIATYRPFVKWPGSKYKVLNIILSKLPKGKILVEPFVGSGSVFLNTNYEYYVLSDLNYDIINLYKTLQQYGEEFIKFCKSFFIIKNNTATQYYRFREQFNNISNEGNQSAKRAALFLYLNRHGYNGLCRFNKKLKFNVPFGRHNNLNFPEEAMRLFYIKSKIAKFLVQDFEETLISNLNNKQASIYCDPPYVPISKTANFVGYLPKGFSLQHQVLLADLAVKLSNNHIPVLISNHFNKITQDIYRHATELTTFQIKRMISCNPKSRNYVTEVLASYLPKF